MWLLRHYSSNLLPFWNIPNSFENYCHHLFSLQQCHGHSSSLAEGFCSWCYTLLQTLFSTFLYFTLLHNQMLSCPSSFPCSSLIIFTSIQSHICNYTLGFACFILKMWYSDVPVSYQASYFHICVALSLVTRPKSFFYLFSILEIWPLNYLPYSVFC